MLGKTLISKILNSIVLIILLGYAAIKVLPMLGVEVDPSLEIISKEVVHITPDKYLEYNTLQAKLASFEIDSNQLANALSREGIDIGEFSSQVKLDFVIPENLANNKTITLEFITNKPNPKLSVGYKNIAQQLDKFING